MIDFERYRVLATWVDFGATELQMVSAKSANDERYLLKRLKSDQVTPEQSLRLRDEYKLIAKYRLRCMLTPIRLIGADLSAAILYHVVEGSPGDQVNSQDLIQLLIHAEYLVDAVGEIHEAGLLLGNRARSWP